MVFKKIIFQNSLMANETPSRPPPFMANAILNFHFDFLHTSLIDTHEPGFVRPSTMTTFQTANPICFIHFRWSVFCTFSCITLFLINPSPCFQWESEQHLLLHALRCSSTNWSHCWNFSHWWCRTQAWCPWPACKYQIRKFMSKLDSLLIIVMSTRLSFTGWIVTEY